MPPVRRKLPWLFARKNANMSLLEQLRAYALQCGAYRAEIIRVSQISADPSFAKLCQSNACGNYGRNYTCPPDAGSIEELMESLKEYNRVLVYQTVSELLDSYDFEGMMEAGNRHNKIAQKLWDFTDAKGEMQTLHLGAGGCRLCSVCAKITREPCRHPERAMKSLEAYGVNVTLLAEQAGMQYINGQNTVTYFGAVLTK